jgi:zinc protease
MTVYIAEDQTLPLVSVSGAIRYGNILDPKGKEGMCELLANVMRTGGTQKYQSDSLDALIDLYALSIKISASETRMQFSMSCLSQYLPIGLDVLTEILFHPAFEEKKVKKSVELFCEEIYHRFDNPSPILRAAYQKALYDKGENSRLSTIKSVQSITRGDLIALHQKAMRSENIVCPATFDHVPQIRETVAGNQVPGCCDQRARQGAYRQQKNHAKLRPVRLAPV